MEIKQKEKKNFVHRAPLTNFPFSWYNKNTKQKRGVFEMVLIYRSVSFGLQNFPSEHPPYFKVVRLI